MVKNNFGGNKTKSKARKNFGNKRQFSYDELKKVDGQEYAIVKKKYGGNRFELFCYDKVTRRGVLRGSLARNTRVNLDQLVLVSIRDFQDDTCDVVHVYKPEDCELLISKGDIDDDFAKEIRSSSGDDLETNNIVFTNNSGSETSDDEDPKKSNKVGEAVYSNGKKEEINIDDLWDAL
jgi:translation initiation factor 1A